MEDRQLYRASIRVTLGSLPTFEAGQSIQDQARASLTLVLGPALKASGDEAPQLPDPNLCPNCDQPTASTRSP